MTAQYPPLPADALEVPDHAYAVWGVVLGHLAELEAWLEVHHQVPGIWPQLELTTGHDVLCTARYDAEGICHEHEDCALLRLPGECGDPGCLAFEWGEWPGIDGPVLLCLTHRMPGPGWAYMLDWLEPIQVVEPVTPPCTCWYVRASDVRHAHTWRRPLEVDCYCGAFVFWINVNCWHHGDGWRW